MGAMKRRSVVLVTFLLFLAFYELTFLLCVAFYESISVDPSNTKLMRHVFNHAIPKDDTGVGSYSSSAAISESHRTLLEETSSYLFGPRSSLTKNASFVDSLPPTREARCSSENWIRGWKYAPDDNATAEGGSPRCFPSWEGYGDGPSVLRECLRDRSILIVGDSWAREFAIELVRLVNRTELELIDARFLWRPEVTVEGFGDCRVDRYAQVESFVNVTGRLCKVSGGPKGLHESCGVVVPQVMHLPSYNFSVTFIFKSYVWTPIVEKATEDLLLRNTTQNHGGFDVLLLYIGRWGETRVPYQRRFGMISSNETGKCFEAQTANYYKWLFNLTSRLGIPIINMQTAMLKGDCTETPGRGTSLWWTLKKDVIHKYMPGAVYVPVGNLQRVRSNSTPIGHGLAGPLQAWMCMNVAHIICQLFGRCSTSVAVVSD